MQHPYRFILIVESHGHVDFDWAGTVAQFEYMAMDNV